MNKSNALCFFLRRTTAILALLSIIPGCGDKSSNPSDSTKTSLAGVVEITSLSVTKNDFSWVVTVHGTVMAPVDPSISTTVELGENSTPDNGGDCPGGLLQGLCSRAGRFTCACTNGWTGTGDYSNGCRQASSGKSGTTTFSFVDSMGFYGILSGTAVEVGAILTVSSNNYNGTHMSHDTVYIAKQRTTLQ